MRRFIFLFLFLCAPDLAPAQEKDSPMPVGDEVRAFAAEYTAAWNSRDPASVASFFTSGGSLTVNDGEPLVGREEITGLARDFMTAFPDMVLLLDGLEERGGRVIYRWRFLGTNTGPDGTGKKVDFSGFEVWQLGTDGLIASSSGFFDAAEYEHQLDHGVDGGR